MQVPIVLRVILNKFVNSLVKLAVSLLMVQLIRLGSCLKRSSLDTCAKTLLLNTFISVDALHPMFDLIQ
jgi:hypothetical protein